MQWYQRVTEGSTQCALARLSWTSLRYDHQGEIEMSDESGNPIIFGWTSTGKHIAVIFLFEDDPDLVIVWPKTAYPVPEYGD